MPQTRLTPMPRPAASLAKAAASTVEVGLVSCISGAHLSRALGTRASTVGLQGSIVVQIRHIQLIALSQGRVASPLACAAAARHPEGTPDAEFFACDPGPAV